MLRGDSSSKELAASLTHIYFTQFLDDSLDEERAFGTLAGLQLLSECDERARTQFVLGTFGDSVSRGMVTEIIAAKEQMYPGDKSINEQRWRYSVCSKPSTQKSFS